MKIAAPLFLLSLLTLGVSSAWGQSGDNSAPEVRRGESPVDAFHPDREHKVEPAYGGTVTIHMPGRPASACYPVENSSYARRMLRELHETLVERDWESWEWIPVLATHWDTEDRVFKKDGTELFGEVTEDGETWVVKPLSRDNPLEGTARVPKADVDRIARGTVLTFYLKENVLFHDGHPLTARDVVFSWEIYTNPHVDCDEKRNYYEQMEKVVAVDEHTARFFFAKQYFSILEVLDGMIILPTHYYDLLDPDNEEYNPDATLEQRGTHINDNPHNTDWIGLGPYRMTKWDQQVIEAERFDGYFDPEHAGYFDRIRWRVITNDDTAFQALLNGELDFFDRVKSEDYFGQATQSDLFKESFYKGYYYIPAFNYTAWNMRRPVLKDLQVRRALAHAFDWESWLKTKYNGLGKIVTGPQFYFGQSYNREVTPYPYDPDLAEEMLAEAGWYDRDGDGVIDKDGIPLQFEFLMSSGNKASESFLQKLQESLAQVGIKLTITALEWASLLERILDKDFDAVSMAWVLPLESDPEQLWHSDGAAEGVRGSNHSSVSDPYIDELIGRGQVELDDDARNEIWREFHRYLYHEIQPYMFGIMPPRKFAMSQRIRGHQALVPDPGYSIRRWYLPAGTPGTRATR